MSACHGCCCAVVCVRACCTRARARAISTSMAPGAPLLLGSCLDTCVHVCVACVCVFSCVSALARGAALCVKISMQRGAYSGRVAHASNTHVTLRCRGTRTHRYTTGSFRPCTQRMGVTHARELSVISASPESREACLRQTHPKVRARAREELVQQTNTRKHTNTHARARERERTSGGHRSPPCPSQSSAGCRAPEEPSFA